MSAPPPTTVRSRAAILVSLVKTNPFRSLRLDGLRRQEAAPVAEFLGTPKLYLFPASEAEATARIEENLQRFFNNYVKLGLIFFLISLYKKPEAFIIVIASIPIYKYLQNLSRRSESSLIREYLATLIKSVLASTLISLGVPLCLLYSFIAAYTAMLLHGAFRKLSST